MRHSLLALLLVFLTACGFHPVYAPSNLDTNQLSNIKVESMAERSGQQLRNLLLDRGFGDGAAGSNGYSLTVIDFLETEISLGIAKDNTTTRGQLIVTGKLLLSKEGKEVLRRPLRGSATYTVLVSQYGTIAAEDSARRQSLNDIAQQVETHVTLYMRENESQ